MRRKDSCKFTLEASTISVILYLFGWEIVFLSEKSQGILKVMSVATMISCNISYEDSVAHQGNVL